MIVEVGRGTAVVREADDCRRLHVAAPAGADVDAALRASGLGRLGGTDQAELDVATLHASAFAASTEQGWESAWSAMLQYAGTKGWVTSDGRRLLAHVVAT